MPASRTPRALVWFHPASSEAIPELLPTPLRLRVHPRPLSSRYWLDSTLIGSIQGTRNVSRLVPPPVRVPRLRVIVLLYTPRDAAWSEPSLCSRLALSRVSASAAGAFLSARKAVAVSPLKPAEGEGQGPLQLCSEAVFPERRIPGGSPSCCTLRSGFRWAGEHGATLSPWEAPRLRFLHGLLFGFAQLSKVCLSVNFSASCRGL